MNRLIKIICVLVACLGVFSSCARTEKERSKILKIYNWADYIDEDILDEFPVWYKEQTGEDIRIIYQGFRPDMSFGIYHRTYAEEKAIASHRP